ncbi:MAG: hypothetical protein ACXIUO_07245 [Erythrobacter sp.]
MTRQFFALLALLTGLAAFGAPAQATLAEALACDASIAASASDDAARSEQGHFALAESLPANARASRAGEPAANDPAVPASLRLPVLMGIERAYE